MLANVVGASVAGVSIAGAASLLGYHCFSPTSQLYGRTITHCPGAKQLALTYDDGPNDLATERLLEILARHEVRATFFLIGRFVTVRPQIARAVVAAGHAVGNHTQTHPKLLFLSPRRIEAELSDCAKAIADATGVQTHWFRPPFGARRPAVLQIARSLGFVPVMWNVTCFDWKATSATAIEDHARRQIQCHDQQGHIILLHDGGHRGLGTDRQHTVEATDRIVRQYKQQQYHFCSLQEI